MIDMIDEEGFGKSVSEVKETVGVPMVSVRKLGGANVGREVAGGHQLMGEDSIGENLGDGDSTGGDQPDSRNGQPPCPCCLHQ